MQAHESFIQNLFKEDKYVIQIFYQLLQLNARFVDYPEFIQVQIN